MISLFLMKSMDEINLRARALKSFEKIYNMDSSCLPV